MHTVHPAAYVTFKRWLAGKPEREALKRRCDALQADAVQTLLDMALARAEGTAQRFYSLSAQVQRERKQYHDQLQATQRGMLDVTPWLAWFLGCLLRAVQGAENLLADVLGKAQFWQRWADAPMNARQTRVLNRVLDGMDSMEGKLTNAKWAAIAKCSSDTALRDINHLLHSGVLARLEGGGRNTAYILVK